VLKSFFINDFFYVLNNFSKRMSHIKRPMKQIAGITIKSFNPNNIESDLDTIRSDSVRNKITEVRKFKSSNFINLGKLLKT